MNTPDLPPTPEESARLDAIDRLLGMVELLGADYATRVLADIATFGLEQELRWLRNLKQMRVGCL